MIPRTDRSAATSTTPASSKVLRCRYRLAWGMSGTSTASSLVVNTPGARARIRRMRCGCSITSLLPVPIIGNAITSENRSPAGTVTSTQNRHHPHLPLPLLPTRPVEPLTSGQPTERLPHPLAEDPAQLHLRPLFLVLVLWSCGFFVPMPVSCLV